MAGWTELPSPAHGPSAATARPGSSLHRIGCRLHEPGELTPVVIHDGYFYVITESSKVRSELVYDWPTSNGRLPFCNQYCHLANDCTTKYGCIGLMLFRYLSCQGAIICDINTIGIVSVYACSL